MNKIIKTLIIIEVQVVVVLTIIGLFKLSVLDQKVFNINKFVHALLVDKRGEELQQISDDDIVIGSATAPITMFVFSRYGCSACSSFNGNVYPKLYKEFVEAGLVNVVIRQMVHVTKPKILYASKAALFAYKNGFYEDFTLQIHSLYAEFDEQLIDSVMFSFIDDELAYESFMNDKETERKLLYKSEKARKAGVNRTPMFFIGDNKISGTRSYARFKTIIEGELTVESCD